MMKKIGIKYIIPIHGDGILAENTVSKELSI